MLHKCLLISLFTAGLMADSEDVRLCLLQVKFYHPPTGGCHEPLERGPCADTQWLVPSPGDKTVLECQQRPDTPDQNRFILSSNGSVVEDSENEKMFSRGKCKPTERLLPENFVLDTKPCPKHFKCTEDIKVAYKVLKDLEQTNKIDENTLTLDLFKDMICSREPQKRALCLPTDTTGPVTKENLYNSLQIPDLICMENPCPQAEEPYQAKKGYFRCKKILGVNSVTFAGSNPCPKKKVLLRGKCRPRWMG